MAMYEYSTHIDAPLERVFAVAADIPHAADRISGITKVEMETDGAVGVGTRFRETRVMFGKEHTETLEVTAFDPPRSYSVGCDSCGVVWDSTFTFTADGGGTRVELVMTSKPSTFAAKVIGAITAPMMRKSMEKCINSDLADLKRACETGVVENANVI